jgi:hypothetical protein
MQIPKIFTPNGDIVNDSFDIITTNIESLSVFVNNRGVFSQVNMMA